jgi:tetratricopeptide (TPR) repeat protein
VSDLSTRLQSALGDGYRIDRELGGGGMSRVFLATELRLGRSVVVKVLPPEMGAGVNVERFEREIQLAARLQHPHIVPLLSAGAKDDLLYYIMPFIEGESLRAKLAREGELPVAEAVRILKEVLDALQYAHGHRVVHRDIKPDNVLLSGRHALVTDFGVAKAVSESTGAGSLTSLGVALGTPAYMAPEQAAADPHVDHRADLYAVGALAYEMLTGRPPFTGPSPQAILAAHITQAPAPLTGLRDTVPAALNELILRCLSKKPADRWQRAEELIPHLDALLTPTRGTTLAGVQPAPPPSGAATRGHPARVVGWFLAASAVVLAFAYAVVYFLGLPDWVFAGAIGLLLAGLPIMVLTGLLERRRARAHHSGTSHPTPVGLARHLTWRTALRNGGLAFLALGLAAAGFMASRALGVGPGATLVSSGILAERDRLIVASFENLTADSSMGETVTELLRIDLAQSPSISVMAPSQVSEVLARMKRPSDTVVGSALAAEVAAREGVKAYLTGEIRAVGSGFVIAARLVNTSSGDVLVPLRESAADASGVVGAVDRLSAKLRERVGESLRTVRAEPALERVTTASLDALRLYASAERASDRGDYDRAVALLEQAVGADSSFAMAWRRIGMYLTNPGTGPVEVKRGMAALDRAAALKDRLTDRERLFVEAAVATRSTQDLQRSISAYLAILETYPDDPTALNNLGVTYVSLGRSADAQRAFQRLIETGTAPSLTYGNLVTQLSFSGKLDEADSVNRRFGRDFPESEEIGENQLWIALSRQDLAAVDSLARTLLAGSPEYRQFAHNQLSRVAEISGRFGEADRERSRALEIQRSRGALSDEELGLVLELNRIERWSEVDSTSPAMGRRIEELWTRNVALTEGRNPSQRRYQQFAAVFTRLGLVARARQIIDEYLAPANQKTRDPAVPLRVRDLRVAARVAAAEGRTDEAISRLEEGCALMPEDAACIAAAELERGEVHDRAGNVDSAIAAYQRFADIRVRHDNPAWRRLAPTHYRLGELYEGKGDRKKAIESYGRFLELWRNADSELQPMVRATRTRVAKLTREIG